MDNKFVETKKRRKIILKPKVDLSKNLWGFDLVDGQANK